MAVEIDREACIGCGCCGEACAQGALELEEKAVVFEQYCTACGACIEMCPVAALSLPGT
jgi:electron transfer flavoprotein alpha subunit